MLWGGLLNISDGIKFQELLSKERNRGSKTLCIGDYLVSPSVKGVLPQFSDLPEMVKFTKFLVGISPKEE